METRWFFALARGVDRSFEAAILGKQSRNPRVTGLLLFLSVFLEQGEISLTIESRPEICARKVLDKNNKPARMNVSFRRDNHNFLWLVLTENSILRQATKSKFITFLKRVK